MTDPRRDRPAPEPAALLSGRITEYVDIWERAASRLVRTEYHAEDFLDDWFRLWGKWMRDLTATAALTWRASGADAKPTSGGGHESDVG
jgi:hypothetical protein